MVQTRSVGTLVHARGRDWVVLPSPDDDLLLLRPLGGMERDVTGIYLPLEGHAVRDAGFAWPDPQLAGDSVQARLLRDAVRLNFRAGAGPLRSLGHIAVEPRAYQLVPLLMALRLDPIRLLIADDVGIGKTIEALLIARELLDRGEISRIAVICLPHLCDQWQAEMRDKFGISAEVVRPGTVARLERNLPTGVSLFEENRFVVVSIDYIKSDKRRADFVRACPEFVIVDEAHAAADAGVRGAQHQRHELLQQLAKDAHRHMVLTTATPHSGIESAFRSLLTLLDPVFAGLPEDEHLTANDPLRLRLAQHLVQRRRPDIRTYLEDETAFPERVSTESTYALSPDYQRLYRDVLEYARELVRGAEGGPVQRRRIRWWAALAMLRCVSSSPAAAQATLLSRANGLDENAHLGDSALEALGERAVLDLDSAEATEGDDVVPGSDTVEGDAPESAERARLRALARAAEKLRGEKDRKLLKAVEIIKGLLADGFSPIIYCRYIATAEYVAEELGKRLKGVQVMAVTGALPPEAREERVSTLQEHLQRVLVATDCLSEGINLQAGFDSVLHYDLSWNPTRHEQREGRVDRFGQQRPEVRTVLLYGEDNAVDGAVLRVLLKKAESIRKRLGVSVPVPSDTAKVMEAIFESLFQHGNVDTRQLMLPFAGHDVHEQELELAWEKAAGQEERRRRTIFAQQAMKPEDVRQELAAARRALGSYDDVARFVREAADRLGAPLAQDSQGRTILAPGNLPPPVREVLSSATPFPIGFHLPVQAGATHIGRTSPLVEALGAHLTGTALDTKTESVAARTAAMRTRAVTTRTTLLLLRIRMHIDVTRQGKSEALLAEEVVTAAYQGRGEAVKWLSTDEAEALLDALPAANIPREQVILWLRQSREDLPQRQDDLNALARDRASAALEAHRRVRDAANISGVRYQVRALLPPDVLGLYVFMPMGG